MVIQNRRDYMKQTSLTVTINADLNSIRWLEDVDMLQGRNNWVNLSNKLRVWLRVWLGIQCHEPSRMTQQRLIIAGIDVICNQKSSYNTRMSARGLDSGLFLQQLNCLRMTGCLIGYDWRMTVLYPRTVLQIKLFWRRIERTSRQGWQIDIRHGLKSC